MTVPAADACGEALTPERPALGADLRDIGGTPQTRDAHKRRDDLDDDDALAATRATGREHFAATRRLHARAKTVHPRATTCLRLVRALHDRVPSPRKAINAASMVGTGCVCLVQSIARSCCSLVAWLPAHSGRCYCSAASTGRSSLVFHRCGDHRASACGERPSSCSSGEKASR